MPVDRIDAVVSLAKRRGLVFPSSEIYGGTRSAWDYGPLGVELKENVRRQWWRTMVQQRDDIVGLDSAVILARDVWAASGHLDAFVDPLTECQSCHKRFRADHLEEAFEAKHGKLPESLQELNCPNCGNKGTFTEPHFGTGKTDPAEIWREASCWSEKLIQPTGQRSLTLPVGQSLGSPGSSPI